MRLASRRVLLWAVLAGVLLSVPALFGGLQTEDWVFRGLVQAGDLRLPHQLNLWEAPTRLVGDFKIGAIHAQMNVGLLPWIASPSFEVSFWRPLASLTHQLDYIVWPDAPLVMHAENLAIYALLIAGAAALYRRLLEPAWVAGLAALLFAVDDAHGQAIGWITNRNGLLAAAFAVLALWAHDRARRDGWRPGLVVAPVLLALGFASGETALGIVGYFAAHAVIVDRARLVSRVTSALPWLTVTLSWAILYRKLGYGVSGSGLYTDPWAQPVQFLTNAPERLLALLVGLFAAPPSDIWISLDRAALPWAALVGALILALLAAALTPWLRREQNAHFWLLGSALSLLPACATFPEDRLLLVPGLGAMALIAGFVAHVAAGARGAFARGSAVALFSLHAVVAPLLLPWRVLAMQRYDSRLTTARDSAYSLLQDTKQELVLVNAPDFYFAVMLLLTQNGRGDPAPARQLCLAGTLRDVILYRPDSRSIEILAESGFMEEPFNRLYRAADERVARHDKVLFDGLEVQATRVNERGEPTGVLFRFAEHLESTRYVWGRWQKGRYVPFSLPEVGATFVLRDS